MYEQARKAIWEAINPHSGKRRIDEAFPPELRKRTDNSSMTIEFVNGSIWKVVGSDNPDSLVGAPPAGIVFSEWALSNPSAWAYLAPILAENGGWSMFITTPRGRNHAFDMLELRGNPKWFVEVLTPKETGFPLDLVESQRKEYHKIFGQDAGDALIEQEYWCSFEAAILGAYYGKELVRAQNEGRLTSVAYEPSLPVHTAWDLGKGQNMAIWCFQISLNEVRIIDYFAGAHDQAIPECVQALEGKPYRWGNDYVPHDAKVKELGTGRTRVETLIALKRKPVLVPGHKIDDGITAGRLLLRNCWFDEPRCKPGIECLRQYKAQWDEDRKCFKDTPEHDWTSHACLTADAQVLTECGYVSVADIHVGERVWTPRGWSRVLCAGPVKVAKSLIEIETVDGRKILCTPEHKLLAQRGFVRADALRYSDKLFEGSEWPIVLSSLISRVLGIGFRAAITGETTGLVARHQTCTGQYGRITMGGLSAAVRTAVSRSCRLILRAPSGAISIARWKRCENGVAGQLVYDLTVAGHACYQANGLLVSNSDAFRYLAMAWRELVPEPPPKPEPRTIHDMTLNEAWKLLKPHDETRV